MVCFGLLSLRSPSIFGNVANFPQVYISHFLLLPIFFGALLWAALLPLSPLATCMQTTVWGWVLAILLLRGLAVAASWCVASGYLHFFAQRMRGIGYGLPPEHLACVPTTKSADDTSPLPFCYVDCIPVLLDSLSRLGGLWTAFGWGDGRAWTFWFAWLLLKNGCPPSIARCS